jgi:hypothetical protein
MVGEDDGTAAALHSFGLTLSGQRRWNNYPAHLAML